MGLLDGIMGNASEADIQSTERELKSIITTDEKVEQKNSDAFPFKIYLI
ncbi:hypothetical protein ACSVDA_15890 [Cytobacillus sp. Hm23]